MHPQRERECIRLIHFVHVASSPYFRCPVSSSASTHTENVTYSVSFDHGLAIYQSYRRRVQRGGHRGPAAIGRHHRSYIIWYPHVTDVHLLSALSARSLLREGHGE